MAKHISDFTKLPLEIVFDLLNEQNGTALTSADVELGTPTVATGSRNSQVKITARAASEYSGEVVLNYNRLDIQGFTFGTQLTVEAKNAELHSEVIDLINAKLGINLTEDDYIEAEIPKGFVGASWTKNIRLKMNPESYVFIGTLSVNIIYLEIDLIEAIPDNYMAGHLDYLPPTHDTQ